MALMTDTLNGMKQLDAQAIMAAPAVDMNGAELGPAAKVLIWAQAVEEGYKDPAEVIKDWNLTEDENLSTVVLSTKEEIRKDFAEIEEQDPGMYKDFDEYWDSFPNKILLPDDHWLIWCE